MQIIASPATRRSAENDTRAFAASLLASSRAFAGEFRRPMPSKMPVSIIRVERILLGALSVFLFAARAYADEPNYFRDELSSGAISIGHYSCVESVSRSTPNAPPGWAGAYCACSVDVMIRNARRARAVTYAPELAPTWTELQTCGNWANTGPQTHSRTPFGGRQFLNASRITELVMTCDRTRTETDRDWVMAYCGCYADAIRAAEPRATASQEHLSYCSDVATEYSSTGRFPPRPSRPRRMRRR